MNPILQTFQRLRGQPCWGLDYDRNLNLSMNFGKPTLYIREPYKTNSKSEAVGYLARRRVVKARGQWWLWIFCCYWRLSCEERLLATGSSSWRRIQLAIAELKGQRLEAVQITPCTGATRFKFDLGGVLACRRFEKGSDAELWTLYKPNGYVLAVHGNGMYSHQLASKVEKRLKAL